MLFFGHSRKMFLNEIEENISLKQKKGQKINFKKYAINLIPVKTYKKGFPFLVAMALKDVIYYSV